MLRFSEHTYCWLSELQAQAGSCAIVQTNGGDTSATSVNVFVSVQCGILMARFAFQSELVSFCTCSKRINHAQPAVPLS